MSIRVTDAKRGMVLRHEGELFQIVKYDHVAPGNWRAINHLLLRNMKTGKQKELRLPSSATVEPVYLDNRTCQYLYRDASGHVFMDTSSYEQFHLPEEVIRESLRYIVEGDSVDVVFAEGEALTVQLPTAVTLEVSETEDAARGDTATSVQKNATLSTGHVVRVPAHIKVGEKVKVNTETGEFLGRA
jgi:elongation factor P